MKIGHICSINNSNKKQKTKNKKNLLKSLNSLAESFLKKFKSTNSEKSLHESLNTFLLADQLIYLMLIESQEKHSKLFWRKQSAELYGKAIEACFLANDAEKAFYFMEKNKALLLTQDLKNQQLKQALNLPDSLVNLEIELKKAVFNLEHIESNSTNKDSITIELLSKERELQKLQESIQKNFNSYKAIDTKTTVVSLNELQNSLDNNTAVLAYNIGEYDDYSLITPENGYTPIIPDCKYGVKTFHPAYGMLITKDQVNFFELKNAKSLKDKVQELISMMRTPFKTEKNITSYNKNAFDLYNTLLPVKFQDKIKNKKLRIIPDNYLHYLPFEALITSKENNYWIQENEISYAYSNSFLQNLNAQEKSKANSFVGFAPVNYASANLNPLQNSLEETNQVINYFSGANYTHEKATKAQFLKALPKYDIIHLATHADAQDSISPWIAFSNDKLDQDELTLTTNQAQMVVLSGCNTLLGKQEIGEGVMSLARGFFHSGAQSVISSLWTIDDRSTAEIMSDFYRNLSQHQSKSKSLQKAKINYLNNHSLSEASPYYWASFVVLGNTQPLISDNKKNWLIYFLGIILIGFIIFSLNKNFKSKK